MKKWAILIFCFLFLLGMKEKSWADDLDIYTPGAAVKPNVMIIFDNSTSMEELVPYLDTKTYGGFDGSGKPLAGYYYPKTIYYRDCCLVKGCHQAGSGGNPCKDERCSLEIPWEVRLARFWNERLSIDEAQAGWDDLCTDGRSPASCSEGQALFCEQYRYSEYIPGPSGRGFIDVVPYKDPDGLDDNNNDNLSGSLWLVKGNRLNWAINARKRYDVAVEAISAVIDRYNDNVNFGLMVFRTAGGEINGGKLLEPISTSMGRETKKQYLKDWLKTKDCKPGGKDNPPNGIMFTPLAETLTHAGMYFRGGVTAYSTERHYGYPELFFSCVKDANPNKGEQGSPKLCDERTAGWIWAQQDRSPVPVTESCQKNYVILMTDGNPSFDTNQGILRVFLKDYDKQDLLPETSIRDDRWTGETHKKYTQIPGDNEKERNPASLEQQHFLDNVARYLYETDLIADEKTLPPAAEGKPGRKADGKQNVMTYVVGFGIGNELLKSTGYWGTGGGGVNQGFILAGDTKSLESAFTTFIKEMLKTDVIFAKPAIPGVGMVTGDYIYIPSANTDFRVGGDVKKKQISTDKEIWSVNEKLTKRTMKDRKIYTLIGSWSKGSAINLTANEFRDDKILPGDLGLDTSATAKRDDIVDYVRGLDISNPDRTNRLARGKILGGVLHSSPAVVNYYEKGKTKVNQKVVYFGANDGMLHAVDDSDITGGQELWAFIPPDLLPTLQNMVNLPENRNYYVDSSPKAVALDSNNQITRDAKKIEKRILVFGERKGGNHYWALDVSSPLNPKVLWKVNGDMDDFSELGQTWSEPSFGKIKNSAGQDVTVAFFGGGYPTTQRNGRAIYAVDVLNGTKVWWRTHGSQTAGNQLKWMTDAIPSEVLVTDTDNDGYTDFIFVGDLGGQMQVHNLSDKFTASDSDKSRRLFKPKNKPKDSGKIFYAPDVVKEVDGHYIYFGTGDRDNPVPSVPPVPKDPDRFYCVKDKFEIVKKTVDSKVTEEVVFKKEDLNENNMLNLTANPYQDSQGISPDLASKYGWYMDLPNKDEKVLAPPAVALGVVLFTTFTPADGQNTSDDPCTINPGGVSRLYAVSYLDATAVFRHFSGDNSLTTADRSYTLAGGIPTAVLLSFKESPPTSGQPNPPLQMKVDVFPKRDPDDPPPIEKKTGDPGPAPNESGYKGFTWRAVNP